MGLLLAATLGCTAKGTVGPVIAEGIASRYADSLAGRPTASGEPYELGKATCAHKTLPLGTLLEVERVTTGAKERCRVNDRGPYHGERIIDLSRSVASALEIEGVAKVRLRKVTLDAN